MLNTQNSSFLLSVLENIEEGVIACDIEGKLVFFNRKAREVYGPAVADVPPEKWSEQYMLFAEDGKTPLEMEDLPLFRALKDETVKDFEIVLAKPNQAPIFLVTTAHPLYGLQGEKIGAVVTFRDVTEDRRIASRFRTIFEQSPLSIQIFSSDGKTKLVNKAWQKMWNVSDEFIRDYVLKEYNCLNDPLLEEQGVLDLIKKGFAGEVVHVPSIFYDPKKLGLLGNSCWVESMIYPLKDVTGEVIEVVVLHVDVTQDYRAKEYQAFLTQVTSVLISTLEYDQMIEQLAQIVITSIADGCIVDLLEDDQINRIVSTHRDPEIEKLMKELQNNYSPTMTSSQLTGQVLKTGQPVLIPNVNEQFVNDHCVNQNHVELIKKMKVNSVLSVPLEIRGKIIGVISLLMTETSNRRFDEMDLKVALELSNKASVAIENSRLFMNVKNALKQRDEFISIASHELKTPITSLKLQMQVASRKTARSGSETVEAKYVKSITDTSNRQLDRLTRLVEDMLDMSRISTGKLAIDSRSVDFSDLTQEVLERFQEQLKELNVITTFSIEDQVFIKCDPYRMEQVITNLISNAIRYGNGKPIKVLLKTDENKVILQVRDNGIGIAEKDMERIFDRFERAVSPNDVSGLGLGLFISKEIVHAHSG